MYPRSFCTVSKAALCCVLTVGGRSLSPEGPSAGGGGRVWRQGGGGRMWSRGGGGRAWRRGGGVSVEGRVPAALLLGRVPSSAERSAPGVETARRAGPRPRCPHGVWQRDDVTPDPRDRPEGGRRGRRRLHGAPERGEEWEGGETDEEKGTRILLDVGGRRA